jgi:hypothetical protein
LLIDPFNSKIVYSLDRQNKVLYRTTNGGTSWAIRSAFAEYNQSILVLSGLTPLGHTLYMNGLDGLYASADAGAHWRLGIQPPSAGTMGPSIRGSGAGSLSSRKRIHSRRDFTWRGMVDPGI